MPNHLNAATADLETGVGAWLAWYNCTVTQSTEQAYTGSNSLKIEKTAAGTGTWGVQFNNWPGFAASTGSKTLRLRARQISGMGSSRFRAVWRDSGNTVVGNTDLAISGLDTTWQLFTTTQDAPAGAAKVFIEFTSTSDVAQGATFYIDDIYVGDVEADTTPPTFTSWATNSDGTSIIGTASEALDPSYVPVLRQITLTVNGSVREITSVGVSGSTATLTPASPIVNGDVITVSGAP